MTDHQSDSNQNLLERLAGLGGLRLFVWLVLASTHFSSIDIDLHKVESHGDGHMFYSHEDTARRTMVQYREFPMWDPYACGGIPGLANPQSTSIAPDFLLRLIFGTDAGRRLAILLFFIIGLEAMFRLGCFYGLSPTGCILAGIIFNACGYLTVVRAVGWTNMLTFHLIPLIVYGFEKGLKSRKWCVAGGMAMAWMIMCSGTYPFPYALLVLGALCVIRTVELVVTGEKRRPISVYRPLWTLLLIIGVALLLSSARLVPLSIIVFGQPRLVNIISAPYNAHQLLAQLLDDTVRFVSYYIGPLVLILACVSARAKAHGARLLALVFLFFALGNFSQWAPVNWLAQFPFFNQLRSPERHLILVVFYIALAAGHGLSTIEGLPAYLLERFAPKSPIRPLFESLAVTSGYVIGIGVLVFTTLDLAPKNGIWEGRVYSHFGPLSDNTRDFKQTRGNTESPHFLTALNMGNISCIEATSFPKSTLLRGDLPTEEYPLDPSLASVKRLAWTPNTIKLAIDAKKPTKILVNQNYHAYWRSNLGTVVNHRGLLAVAVPRGKAVLELSYRDYYFYFGLVISTLGLIAALVFMGRGTGVSLARLRRQWPKRTQLAGLLTWNIDPRRLCLQLLGSALCLVPVLFYVADTQRGLEGSYFKNTEFKDSAFTRQDDNINFNWKYERPMWGMPKNYFSVRWQGCIEVPPGKPLLLRIGAVGIAKAFMDGRLSVEVGPNSKYKTAVAKQPLAPGVHKLRVDYEKTVMPGRVKLEWTNTSGKFRTVGEKYLLPPGKTDNSRCPRSWFW